MNRDLNRVSVWCNLYGMKLNASKTKTMIVSRSRTVHPQLTPLTLDVTVLKESANLVILWVTFDAKMTFEKHLRSVSSAAAHWHSFAPPRCRTSQHRRTFVPLSVSLWNDLSDPVFNGVGLAGFKSRANAFLLA